VKRMEELGIGRPSTYASIIQVLKDRDYVVLEQKRFHPQEKGRLVTAFLERFFERYVEYDFTADLENRLDDISAGSAAYLEVLRAFWADFKPRADDVQAQKPWDVEAAMDEYLAPYLFPKPEDGGDPRLCPSCGQGQLSLKLGRYGPFVACSNYPECRYTRKFASPEAADEQSPHLGEDPDTGLEVELKSGRFGRYLQSGDKRVSVPRDVEELTLEVALKLLALPREIGLHPETGLPIEAGIGRFGPYLRHDGKYANLKSTAELFEIGMNAAVVRLAEVKKRRAAPEPIAVVGAHPESGAEIRLMDGRFGPYVTDGTINASLPRNMDAKSVTLDDAVALLAARAEKAPKKRRKAAAKKPAAKKAAAGKSDAKKPAAKKPAAKKSTAKKPAAKKPAARKSSTSKAAAADS